MYFNRPGLEASMYSRLCAHAHNAHIKRLLSVHIGNNNLTLCYKPALRATLSYTGTNLKSLLPSLLVAA